MEVRNTVLLGLMVYQGLHSGGLQGAWEVGHIRLDEGKVYVPGSARSSPMAAPGHHAGHSSWTSTSTRRSRGSRPVGDKAFSGNVRNHLAALIPQAPAAPSGVRNALHIRASVILGWLKVHNKRRVQYMAGHRHIESTERYSLEEMGSLTDQLAKHHPFG